jgi:cbb3-type cytochrome oxidase maturation protein
MSVIVILISVSVMIALGFLMAFLWSLKSGQYDDTYSPSVRMLFDNKPKKAAGKDASHLNIESYDSVEHQK